ncbi:MAG: DUF2203 domain-containing protein [Pirellulales bacterium]
MSNEPYEPQKLFTVEKANASLPLVRAIAKDLSELSRDVLERRDRLAQLMAGHDARSTNSPYHEELVQQQEDLKVDAERIDEYVEELRALGVEPKNGVEGLMDFPARMDGRIVYLCWKLGEPEVLHWHELDAGFAGRHPLAAGSLASEGNDSEFELGE